MQPTGGGGGLARFRSAPATWLEALLESEEEELEDVVVDPPTPKPTTTPTPTHTHQLHNISPNPPKNPSAVVDPELLFGSTGGGGCSPSSFLRQNSSPAEFLSQIDGYFSNFGIPPPPNYDHYLSPTLDVSGSSKRPRVIDSQHPSLKFPSQLQVVSHKCIYYYIIGRKELRLMRAPNNTFIQNFTFEKKKVLFFVRVTSPYQFAE